MKLFGVVVIASLVACGSGDETSEVESPIVNPSGPYVNTADLAFLYPVLAVQGRLPNAAVDNVSPAAAHAARYANGVDLSSAPLDRDTFTGKVHVAGATYLQPPTFPGRVDAALGASDAHLGTFDATLLKAAAGVLSYIPGFHSEATDPITTFAGWTPPRARWADAVWSRPPGTTTGPETHYHYPTPWGIGGMPERGARLYCAARETARNQADSGSLGEQVLLPIDILGQHLDLGVFEATAFVNEPQRLDLAANDGAQAFTIPFDFGVRITPIRPITPPLPEVRYPFVLSTADGELATDVGRELIYEDQRCFFGGLLCLPVVRLDARTRYKTVVHADTAASVGQAVTAGGSFPIFWAGPMLVKLDLAFGAGLGQQVPRLPPFDVLPTRATIFDDRLLRLAVPPAKWPTQIREGGVSDDNLDGYWSLGQFYPPDSPLLMPFDVHDHVGTADSIIETLLLGPSDPLRSMAQADDDHHVAPVSELALSGAIDFILGFDASIASITITATGQITGALGLAHDVRDGVSATRAGISPQPVAGVTITPRTYGDAVLKVKVSFHLHIDLVIDSIDVDFDFIDANFPIDPINSTWDERHRMRIGTESTRGDPTQSPIVTSHVATTSFLSFPDTMPSVAACLADHSDVPPPPPPCESHPVTPEIPRVGSCISTEISPQIDPCLHIPIADQFSPIDVQCQAAMLTYMCSPVSKEQVFAGTFRLAHVIDIAPPPDSPSGSRFYSPEVEKLARFSKLCALANLDAITSSGSTPSAWFAATYPIGPCNATTGELIDPKSVITSSGAGPVTAPPPCH